MESGKDSNGFRRALPMTEPLQSFSFTIFNHHLDHHLTIHEESLALLSSPHSLIEDTCVLKQNEDVF